MRSANERSANLISPAPRLCAKMRQVLAPREEFWVNIDPVNMCAVHTLPSVSPPSQKSPTPRLPFRHPPSALPPPTWELVRCGGVSKSAASPTVSHKATVGRVQLLRVGGTSVPRDRRRGPHHHRQHPPPPHIPPPPSLLPPRAGHHRASAGVFAAHR